jgi:hypothetical protein
MNWLRFIYKDGFCFYQYWNFLFVTTELVSGVIIQKSLNLGPKAVVGKAIELTSI